MGLRRMLGLKRNPPPPNFTPRLYRTETGNWWLPQIEGDCVARDMRKGRVFEPGIVNEVSRWIGPGSTVLDVGSNYGQMAVLFSRIVGETGTVHAFEADPYVCEILRRNVKENGAANIIVHEGAVWHEPGRDLPFPEPDFSRFHALGSFGIQPNSNSTRLVRSITIDDLNIEKVDFMKIDIQGSDLYGMLGARRTIERDRMPIIFEFEEAVQDDFGTTFEEYISAVHSFGYQFSKVVHGNFLITARQVRSAEQPALDECASNV